MNDVSFFLPITKVDKKQRMVWGYASTPTKDLDDEIISLDAIKAALPSYMEWRNIREMHQASAVGTAKEANVDEKGLYLGAKIVDDAAWKKVEEEVYKGFSIGGRKITKKGDTITELELIEISLVDRPANPDCRIEVFKAAGLTDAGRDKLPEFLSRPRGSITVDDSNVGLFGKFFKSLYGSSLDVSKRDFSDKERDAAAETGAALPDGSFPIKNAKDLENAIQAHGRAKNKARAKRHIITRARALGLESKLPDDWKKKLAKEAGQASYYTISRLLSLLGELECIEEGLEGDPRAGNCEPYYFGTGATRIKVSKEMTNRFGTLLVEFGDMIAELLDDLLKDMNEEEAEEARTTIEAAALPDIFKRLEELTKRNVSTQSHGDSIKQLKELFQ